MKLCQLDTCIITDLLENSKKYENFVKFIVDEKCYLCLSPFTFYELKKVEKFYKQFFKYFPPKRLCILDLEITEKEINNYCNGKHVEPIFLPPLEDLSLENIFSSVLLSESYNFIDRKKQGIIDKLKLVKELQLNLNKKDINEYVQEKVERELEHRFKSKYLDIKKTENKIDLKKIKSLAGYYYLMFYKIHLLR